MKKITAIIFFITSLIYCQTSITVRKLSSFPEDYLNKEISFKDIWQYPILTSSKNDIDGKTYYEVKLQITSPNEEEHFGMGLNCIA